MDVHLAVVLLLPIKVCEWCPAEAVFATAALSLHLSGYNHADRLLGGSCVVTDVAVANF